MITVRRRRRGRFAAPGDAATRRPGDPQDFDTDMEGPYR